MSKILLKLSFVIFVIAAPICLTARTIGAQRPANAILGGFKENCQNTSDICWYGVTINQTPVRDAWKKLEGHTYFLVSTSTKVAAQNVDDHDLACGAYFISEYATINGLVIRCRDLLLGDWINQFGMPDAVDQSYNVLFYTGKTKMRLQIKGALTPEAPIIEFTLYIPRALTEYEYDWRGFAPRWRYCQLNTFNPCA